MLKTQSLRHTSVFIFIASLVLFGSVSFVHAANTLQDYIYIFTDFINDTLLPLLFAIALLFFLVNIVRFFIIDGADTYSKEQAKKFAMYGIIAFVFLTSIWGITNLIINGLEIDNGYPLCPDYNEDCNEGGYDAFRYSEGAYSRILHI